MRFLTLAVLAAGLTVALPMFGAQVDISVSDSGGTPLKGTLVIVQDLQRQERELFRVLTDEHGKIPTRTLDPGLYRAIGTYPYGQWRNNVREFLVRDAPVKVQLQLAQSNGMDSINVAIGQLKVTVLDAAGKPADGARVLVRDVNATPQSEHWGTTDAQGHTTLELTVDPAALVVVYRDQLYSFAASGLDTERTLRLK